MTFFLKRYMGEKKAIFGLSIVVFFIIISMFDFFISPYDPTEMIFKKYLPPTLSHPFGTDHFGRDVLSRTIHGARVSIIFGMAAAGMSGSIGVILGALPGYYGGLIDDLFSRFFEIFLMIPKLFLLILVALFYGHSFVLQILWAGLILWPSNAKIMRAQVYTLKERGFVKAVIGAGGSNMYVLFKHIIPNGASPVIANTTLNMASAIILEASLSFLGLGDVNVISWGGMLRDSQQYLPHIWWMAIFPGLCIMLICLGFNIIGDRLNVILNPKLMERV